MKKKKPFNPVLRHGHCHMILQKSFLCWFGAQETFLSIINVLCWNHNFFSGLFDE